MTINHEIWVLKRERIRRKKSSLKFHCYKTWRGKIASRERSKMQSEGRKTFVWSVESLCWFFPWKLCELRIITWHSKNCLRFSEILGHFQATRASQNFENFVNFPMSYKLYLNQLRLWNFQQFLINRESTVLFELKNVLLGGNFAKFREVGTFIFLLVINWKFTNFLHF